VSHATVEATHLAPVTSARRPLMVLSKALILYVVDMVCDTATQQEVCNIDVMLQMAFGTSVLIS
jgi:hypothetical protein